MAERLCDCGVLCLRTKSSLCSCRQLLYVMQALHRTCLCREVGIFRRGCVTFTEYFTGKAAWPTNQCWCQEARVIAVSCAIVQNIRSVSFSFVTIHASDRQTDGRTDIQNCNGNTVRCITCSRTVKTDVWQLFSIHFKIKQMLNTGFEPNRLRPSYNSDDTKLETGNKFATHARTPS